MTPWSGATSVGPRAKRLGGGMRWAGGALVVSLLLLAVVTGCACSPDCLNRCAETRLKTNEARLAYAPPCNSCVADEFAKDYERGWKDGYLAVSEGRSGTPPAVPPYRYRTFKFQSGCGQQAANAWYQGYAAGAAAAKCQRLDLANRVYSVESPCCGCEGLCECPTPGVLPSADAMLRRQAQMRGYQGHVEPGIIIEESILSPEMAPTPIEETPAPAPVEVVPGGTSSAATPSPRLTPAAPQVSEPRLEMTPTKEITPPTPPSKLATVSPAPSNHRKAMGVRREIARPEPVALPSNLSRLESFFSTPAKPSSIAQVPPPLPVRDEAPVPKVASAAPISPPKPVEEPAPIIEPAPVEAAVPAPVAATPNRAKEPLPMIKPAPVETASPAPVVAMPERLAQPEGVASKVKGTPPKPLLVPKSIAPLPKQPVTKVEAPKVASVPKPRPEPIVRKERAAPPKLAARPLEGVDTREKTAPPEPEVVADADVVYPDGIGFPEEMLPSADAPLPNKLVPIARSKTEWKPIAPRRIDITRRDPVPPASRRPEPQVARSELQQPREFTAADSMQPLQPSQLREEPEAPMALAQPSSLLASREVAADTELTYPVGMSAPQKHPADTKSTDSEELTYPEEWIIDPGTYSAEEIRFPEVIWPASYSIERTAIQ